MRAAAKPTDALAGVRVANSVARVRMINMTAPASAADPNEGVKQEADADIEGHPRQIEEGAWTAAAQVAADLVEVSHRLQPVAATRSQLQRLAYDDVVYPPRELGVDGAADAQQNSAADHVQDALKGEKSRSENSEAD